MSLKVEWSSVPMEAGLKCVAVEHGAKFQQAWYVSDVSEIIPQSAFIMSSHIQIQFTPLAFNANVTGDYYGMDNLPLNFVNIRQCVCRPSGKFSDCISPNVHSQGCNGLLASVACPGIDAKFCA